MKKTLSLILTLIAMACVFTACSSQKNFTSQELVDIINNNGNELTQYNPAVAFDSDNSDLEAFFDWYEIDKNNIEAGAVSFTLMNVKAYQISIVKPVSGKEADVKEDLQNYVDAMVQRFDTYLIDQYEIAQNAILKEENGYIVLVMAEGAQEIYENICAELK